MLWPMMTVWDILSIKHISVKKQTLIVWILGEVSSIANLILSVFQWHWRRCPWTAAWRSKTRPLTNMLLQTTAGRSTGRAALLMPRCKFKWCEVDGVAHQMGLTMYKHSNTLQVTALSAWPGRLVFLQFGDQTWQKALRACWRALGPWGGEACGLPEEALQEKQVQGTSSFNVTLLCTLKGPGVKLVHCVLKSGWLA